MQSSRRNSMYERVLIAISEALADFDGMDESSRLGQI